MSSLLIISATSGKNFELAKTLNKYAQKLSISTEALNLFALVGTHSGGGGLKVCKVMRAQLEHLGTIVLPRIFQVNSSKSLNPDSVEAILKQLHSFI